MLTYRSNDAVITVRQDNIAHLIGIVDINREAGELLGYTAQEIGGKALSSILPPRIASLLDEYVEYQNDANDVGVVLSKVQSFSVVSRDGKESGYRLKVVRVESTGTALQFKLILQDKLGIRRTEAFRAILQENFRGHEVRDPETGLPDRYSLSKDIELVTYYVHKGELSACFAALQMDHYSGLGLQFGRETCAGMLRHIGVVARQSLRGDDIIGQITHNRLGILLLDASVESVRMVLNRLRWQIAATPFPHGKTTVGLGVSMAFGPIGNRVSDKRLIEDCEDALDALDDASANALVEVGEAVRKRAEG